MITKISKINNLGIFKNFHWDDNNLNTFSKRNIIYGWNGTGKTTLTRLFGCLNEGNSKEYPELEYRIYENDKPYKQGQSYNKSVKVFNEDYINRDLSITY